MLEYAIRSVDIHLIVIAFLSVACLYFFNQWRGMKKLSITVDGNTKLVDFNKIRDMVNKHNSSVKTIENLNQQILEADERANHILEAYNTLINDSNEKVLEMRKFRNMTLEYLESLLSVLDENEKLMEDIITSNGIANEETMKKMSDMVVGYAPIHNFYIDMKNKLEEAKKNESEIPKRG